MNAVTIAIAAVLVTAAALVLVRIVRGPTVLDRAVGTDVLVSIVICALGLEAATTRHSTTLPILVSLSLVGFAGSVAVARFVARDRDEPVHPKNDHRTKAEEQPNRSSPSNRQQPAQEGKQ